MNEEDDGSDSIKTDSIKSDNSQEQRLEIKRQMSVDLLENDKLDLEFQK